MLQSWGELREICQRPSSHSHDYERLNEFEKNRTQRQSKTRKFCAQCQCVLYIRSDTDTEKGEQDLDEVFPIREGSSIV